MSKLDVSRMQKWLAAGIQPGLTGPDAFGIMFVDGLQVRPDLSAPDGEVRQNGQLLAVMREGKARLTAAGVLVRDMQIQEERNANARAIRLMKEGHNI